MRAARNPRASVRPREAEAHDHHDRIDAAVRGGRRRALDAVGAARREIREAGCGGEQERRREQRRDGARHEDFVQPVVEKTGAGGGRREHERELAGLREAESGAHRGARILACDQDHGRDHDACLDPQHCDHVCQHGGRRVAQHGRIEEHSDAREEDRQQHAAQGHQLRLHLGRVGRRREHDARREGADRQRESHAFGRNRRAQREQEGEQAHQLARAQHRDPVQQPREDQARCDHQHAERQRRLAQRQRDRERRRGYLP